MVLLGDVHVFIRCAHAERDCRIIDVMMLVCVLPMAAHVPITPTPTSGGRRLIWGAANRGGEIGGRAAADVAGGRGRC